MKFCDDEGRIFKLKHQLVSDGRGGFRLVPRVDVYEPPHLRQKDAVRRPDEVDS